MGAYEDRLAWLDDLSRFFDDLSANALATAVPSCPGWTIENVVAHIGYGALLFWVVPSSHRGLADVRFAAAEQALGDGRGVLVFPGALAALRAVLASHRPDDPWPFILSPPTFDTLSQLASTEIGVHRLDCEDALGQPRSMSAEHALDGLRFTTTSWWNAMGDDMGHDQAPSGGLVLDADGQVFMVGEGGEVASVRGTAVEVLAWAWGRPAHVEITGDQAVAEWWSRLTARTTAVAARS